MSALTAGCSVIRRRSRIHVVDDFRRSPDAATAPMMPTPRRNPLRRGSSSPNPATVWSAPVASSSSIRTPSVATIICRASLQRQPRDAVQIEQRRELLREAVDQIDFAIEVQHLGAERLLLGIPGHEMVAGAPPTGPRRARTAGPSRAPGRRPVSSASVAAPSPEPRHGACCPSASSTATGDAERTRRSRSKGAGIPLTPQRAAGRARESSRQSPRTSRAFCSSASGSNGFVM